MKEKLNKFRNEVLPMNYCSSCPFQETRIAHGQQIQFRCCNFCNDIFNLMPPRIPFAFSNRVRRDDPSVNKLNPCPCQRFGIEHVQKILAEKGL